MGERNFPPLNAQITAFQPQLNISHDTEGYTITLEAAGLSEKDITIEQTDRQLIIKGHKRQEIEDKESHFYRIERQYGEFQRILDLPEDARDGEAKATMTKGLLTIKLPRQELSKLEVRRIEVSNS